MDEFLISLGSMDFGNCYDEFNLVFPLFIWDTLIQMRTPFVFLFPAFVPESWFDALVYHLGLPSYYIANKEFVPSPYNIFSYLNQNSEMLFLWSLLMKSEVALKLLNWTFLVMTLVAVYTFVKIFSDIYCGLVAV